LAPAVVLRGRGAPDHVAGDRGDGPVQLAVANAGRRVVGERLTPGPGVIKLFLPPIISGVVN
jgi:hypothetical protein